MDGSKVYFTFIDAGEPGKYDKAAIKIIAAAAITSFRLHGRGGRVENQEVVRELVEKHKIFTVWRTGIAKGDCVRVTPALYNTPADADRLASALKSIAARS